MKSLHIKEALALHKLWHNVLTTTFEVKKAKFSRLEESFQRIKIITGIPEITLVVENFLTKEQTYEALMSTVNKKESECSKYKKKINEMQTMVNNFSNKEISDAFSLDLMRAAQHEKMKENEELSQKSFIIKNIHGKVKS